MQPFFLEFPDALSTCKLAPAAFIEATRSFSCQAQNCYFWKFIKKIKLTFTKISRRKTSE